MATKRRTRALVAVAAILAVAVAGLLTPPSGPRTLKAFDPEQTAALEVDMWQAYYAKENVRMFADLVRLTRQQFHYSWWTSLRSGFHLAKAAATFGNARDRYERVLPDLETAFTISRDWTGATYDPAALAKSELAWWVARRVPAESSPENVGRLIAVVDGALYDKPADQVLEAAVLRARAGRLRDEGGTNADWPEVSRLLHESYRKLHAAVQ